MKVTKHFDQIGEEAKDIVAKSTPRGLLWDLDGTILDSRAVHWEAWRTFAGQRGQPMTAEYFSDTFGFRNEVILRGHLGAQLSDSEVQQMSLAKEALYRDLLRRAGLNPLPGVLDWLRWAKENGRLQALATMAPQENVAVTLSSLGLVDTFQAVVSAEDVMGGKPDPEVFLLAAERIGVAPARCTVIEDSRQGVEAARRAGMQCVGVGPLWQTLAADVRLPTLAHALPGVLAQQGLL